VQSDQIKDLAYEALDDLKGNNINVLSVGKVSSVSDYMIIASGTSNRHVKALADNVQLTLKQAGHAAIGVEGTETAEWILVDFGGVIVHVMLPATRAFYDLESLWTLKPERLDSAQD
jgi:ribosome-associated protein